jgi:phosphopantothenoylcysteine synthetase/decarboxylase
MRILVTAGNTQVPIDRVRCITNIFTGRTGTRIALHAYQRGHQVQLLTSHPELVDRLEGKTIAGDRWTVGSYRSFAEFQTALESVFRAGALDAVIHCAAVSDYEAAGIYSPAPGTQFDPNSATWHALGHPILADRSAGKVRSDEPELWLRLVRTPKLIDRMRTDWGFAGVLVKFKLEVGIRDDRLRNIAERSRRQSVADLMVANTLEGMDTWAYVGPLAGVYERIGRQELPSRLLDAVERLHQDRAHG